MTIVGTQISLLDGDDEEIFDEINVKKTTKKTVTKESNSLSLKPNHLIKVRILDLIDNTYNSTVYSSTKDSQDVKRIKDSILNFGFNQSGIVCKKGDNDSYILLSGHLRIRALKELLQEGKLSFEDIWVEVKQFASLDDERAYLVLMNTAARNRTDYEKVGEINEFLLQFKLGTSLVHEGENKIEFLSRMMNLNQTQMYKYVNLLERCQFDVDKAQQVILVHETVNKADSTFICTGSYGLNNVETKLDKAKSSKKLLLKDKPSDRLIKKIENLKKELPKSIKLISDISDLKEISPEGNKTLKRMMRSLEELIQKTDTFINE